MIEARTPVLLVGVDGSETSLRAGAYAGGMAYRQRARLVCLYVRTYTIATGVGVAAIPSLQKAHDDIADELREMVESQSARIGISAEFVQREGNPFAEIIRLAKELPADAVIVGASTKAGHRFVGSLAVHLVRASHWPITVVP
ncbi:MAG TPA: universal stress protein [Streptosporangiaceae bacterium]|nr:universal stress protein [Streptosporangiaceae bacterium]